MGKYINKSALVAEIERLKECNRKICGGNFDFLKKSYPEHYYSTEIYDDILSFINTLEVKEVEEPVSNTILLYGLSGSVGIEEAVKETEEYKEWQGDPERQQSFIDFAKFGANYKHHTSKDLEEACDEYYDETWDEHGGKAMVVDGCHDIWFPSQATDDFYKAGALWQKEHLWKDAQGDDLPEIDREVIALLSNGKVVYAHRPQEYWDGKNIATGEVTRYYPARHDKGGWNIQDVKWWLDLELPIKEE